VNGLPGRVLLGFHITLVVEQPLGDKQVNQWNQLRLLLKIPQKLILGAL
jgi:hypothetical protein